MPYRRGRVIISGAHPLDRLALILRFDLIKVTSIKVDSNGGASVLSFLSEFVYGFKAGNHRMGFVNVASAKELKPGSMKDVEVGGKAVLLVNLEGNYYAIGNVCTHMGCMLSDGMLKGDTVQCPCHGSIFNVKTGQVVQGPAAKPEPAYKVKVEGDQILVST